LFPYVEHFKKPFHLFSGHHPMFGALCFAGKRIRCLWAADDFGAGGFDVRERGAPAHVLAAGRRRPVRTQQKAA
jgi:hypothetical protein